MVSKLTTKPLRGAGVSRVILNVPLVGPVSVGVVPAAMLTLGVLLLSRMLTLLPKLFPVAKSGLPSPLKSPVLTDVGPFPVKSTMVAKVGVVAPVAVVLSRIEKVRVAFATAKSGFPSPLKSPLLTDVGLE